MARWDKLECRLGMLNDPKVKWIANRLRQRGYTFYNESTTSYWMSKNIGEKSATPCTMKLHKDGLVTASWRPAFKQFIHLNGYFFLNIKNWTKLDEFEQMCLVVSKKVVESIFTT